MYVWYYKADRYNIVYKRFDGKFNEWAVNESCWLVPGTWKDPEGVKMREAWY